MLSTAAVTVTAVGTVVGIAAQRMVEAEAVLVALVVGTEVATAVPGAEPAAATHSHSRIAGKWLSPLYRSHVDHQSCSPRSIRTARAVPLDCLSRRDTIRLPSQTREKSAVVDVEGQLVPSHTTRH